MTADPELTRIADWASRYPIKPYPPLIINAAITGMVPTAADSPHVPLTCERIAVEAQAVARAGATIIHLHARDADGAPSGEPELYRRIITAVRQAAGELVICASCSGRVNPDYESRSGVLFLDGPARPDMASLTLGSLNFPRQASVNSPEVIARLAQTMHDRGIKPELEAFEPGMIDYAVHLVKRGVVSRLPLYFNLLLGSLGTSGGDVGSLAHMVSRLPPGAVWSAAGIGRFQLPVNIAAVVMGGHVRVGLEDNLYYDLAQRQLATNVMLIERIVRVAAELGRRPATGAETRAMLGLNGPAR